MVKLTNGSSATRNYEEISNTIFVLQQRLSEYKNHLDFISADIYKKFQLLRSDYENNLIGRDILLQFMTPLKKFIFEMTEDVSEKLHLGEILDYLKQENLIN